MVGRAVFVERQRLRGARFLKGVKQGGKREAKNTVAGDDEGGPVRTRLLKGKL